MNHNLVSNFGHADRPNQPTSQKFKNGLIRLLLPKSSSLPRNSAFQLPFQGTYGFYALLQEMPYFQYIELKEKASRDLELMLLKADFPYWRMPYHGVPLYDELFQQM